jgi:hypothetical protein
VSFYQLVFHLGITKHILLLDFEVVSFLSVLCSVVISLSLDQLYDPTENMPATLLLWPPFAFYRALAVMNRFVIEYLANFICKRMKC